MSEREGLQPRGGPATRAAVVDTHRHRRTRPRRRLDVAVARDLQRLAEIIKRMG